MTTTPDTPPTLDVRTSDAMEDGLVRHATGPCAQGQLLVAASAAGLCAVLLGDDTDDLRDQLARTLPTRRLQHAPDALRDTLAQVRAVVDGHAGDRALALDLAGTPFQQSVWNALRAIPAGETRSYAQVAARVGRPGAARAVGAACAANRLAVLVPCHRVVRGDGAAAGYRWGADRRRRLLARESAR